jgi:hypothetical protein
VKKTSNIEHRTSNSECEQRTVRFDARRSAFSVGRLP